MSLEQNESKQPDGGKKKLPDPRFDTDEHRLVRRRLMAARRINRWDQQEAARRLGYATPAPLSKVEMGRIGLPRGFLVLAARVYNVSADFLLGLSDQPERDPRTATQQRIESRVRDELRLHMRVFMSIALAHVDKDFDARKVLERLAARCERIVQATRKVEATQPGKVAHAAAVDELVMHTGLLQDLLAEVRKEISRRQEPYVDPPDPQTIMDLDV
jgi:hypothetical protein